MHAHGWSIVAIVMISITVGSRRLHAVTVRIITLWGVSPWGQRWVQERLSVLDLTVLGQGHRILLLFMKLFLELCLRLKLATDLTRVLVLERLASLLIIALKVVFIGFK